MLGQEKGQKEAVLALCVPYSETACALPSAPSHGTRRVHPELPFLAPAVKGVEGGAENGAELPVCSRSLFTAPPAPTLGPLHSGTLSSS